LIFPAVLFRFDVGDCEGDGCKDAMVDFVKVEVGGFEYFIEGLAFDGLTVRYLLVEFLGFECDCSGWS